MPKAEQTATLEDLLDLGDPADVKFALPDKVLLPNGRRIRPSTIAAVLKYFDRRTGTKVPASRHEYFEKWASRNLAPRGKSIQIDGDPNYLRISANGAVTVSLGVYDKSIAEEGAAIRAARITYLKDHVRVELLDAKQTATAVKAGHFRDTPRKKRGKKE